MFNIINVTTGQSISYQSIPASSIDSNLKLMARAGLNLDNYIVEADCESRFSITAKEWLGIV